MTIAGRTGLAALATVWAATAALSAESAGKEATVVKREWVREHVLDVEWKSPPPKPAETKAAEPGLVVLANNDPVQLNTKSGKPMAIGTKEYSRGLYCHAVSRVVVRLPGPGKTFSAVVGVDANNAPDVKDSVRGSVVFSVTVGDKVVFRSDTLRGKVEGVPVTVDLAGATEFVLNVGDAGDGIAHDQSNWADAKVTMADGKELWLGEMPLREERQDIAATKPAERTSRLPFSFVYRGLPSDSLLAQWPAKTAKEKTGSYGTRIVRSWTEPATGLEVRWVAVEYDDFPAIEWTVYFKNTGTNDTSILENIQGLDAQFERGAKDGEFVLNGIKGDFCTADSFEPYCKVLAPGSVIRFAPPNHSGKSSDGPAGWPYFNLQTPGGGVMLAVGWPGQWAGSFARDAATGLTVRAGQQLTRLHLKPGEEIRTPLIALLFWEGTDVIEAQNLWRRWYRAYTLPRIGGKPQPAVTQIQVGGREQDIAYVQKFLDASIHVDLCWRDAGGSREDVWFKVGPDPLPYKNPGMIWLNSGTWDPDPAKFPNGFKPFSDWVRARGMQFVLWFEPERVGDPNSWLGKNHPEWLLPGTSHGALLDEGHPAARQWLTDHVSGMITTHGLDWYREDMNGGGPLPAWRRNDKPDRQGMTENLYVQGHLAFWDELRRRHPHLRIDSCASGGRRNDLETMRRAVPLLRSDFQMTNMAGVIEGNQGHTYGLSFWLPFQGSGLYSYDTYAYRSFYMPSFGMGGLTPENMAAQQKAYGECRKIAPIMLEGDYYPLTRYSLKPDQWMAWQFNRPEQGDGVVQAFRRGQCEPAAQTYRLRGLDPAATYEVTDFDVAGTTVMSGKDLMDKGLAVEIKDKPGAAVIVYRRAQPQK